MPEIETIPKMQDSSFLYKSHDQINELDQKWQLILENLSNDRVSVKEIWSKHRREFFKKFGNIPLNKSQRNTLRSYKNKFLGSRIFIIGNGPSLNKIDFGLLKDEYTFGVNRINLIYDRTDWRPSFYTVNDWLVGPDNYEELSCHSKSKIFLPKRFEGLINDEKTIYYASCNVTDGLGSFSPDISKGVVMGGTVLTLPIQIAAYMGFSPIILIGVDVDYKVNNNVKQSGKLIKSNNISQFLESTEDDDPNHFDKRYFGTGKKWHNPDPEKMKDGFLEMATSLENMNIRFLNATVGGKLDSITRVDFKSLFPATNPLLQSNTPPINPEAESNDLDICVIIPSYNSCKFLPETIKSIQKNICLRKYAIIIVDDGSTDGTADYIDCLKDDHITLIRQPNSGRSAARNKGYEYCIKHLNPRYVLFQDADDLYVDGAIEILIDTLESDDSLYAVSGHNIRINETNSVIRKKVFEEQNLLLKPQDFLKGPAVMLQSTVFRSKDSERLPIFDKTKAGEDWLFLVNAILTKGKWMVVPIHVCKYRATSNAISKTTLRYCHDMLNCYKQIRARMQETGSLKYLNKSDLAEIDEYQIAKMAGRLFAVGFPILAEDLLKNNPLGITNVQLKSKKLNNFVNFWIIHLDVAAGDLYRKLFESLRDEASLS